MDGKECNKLRYFVAVGERKLAAVAGVKVTSLLR